MIPEKHTSYFNLLEALHETKDCPLCFLEAKTVRSYLDSVLYENVNDPGVRAALSRSKGYCRVHADKLLALRDGLGTAILYQDVVRDLKAFLDAVARRRNKLPRAQLRAWREHAGCPACRVQQEARARYIGTLLSGLSRDEMRMAFNACPGLCLPHLIAVLEAGPDRDTRRYLVEIHQAKYADLHRELVEFCRKHDYRRSREGFGKEGDSWARAVRLISGGAVSSPRYPGS